MAGSLHQLSTLQTDEASRLAAVRRYDILDTPPDGSFDRITAIAANLFSVPISIISLVDHDRIWFKSHHGLDVKQIDRSLGFCVSAIAQSVPWVVRDAKVDVRALANPLVAANFGLRFYAGVPLRTSDGFNLGTLCVMDRKPRSVTDAEMDNLKALASVVMDQLELRLSARRAIAELSQAVAQKDVALQTAELMTREVGHRVMNSLQLVSSLLSMQSRSLLNPEAAAHLADASRRVTAVAAVHYHMYATERSEPANFKDYLRRVCRELSDSLPDSEVIAVKAVEATLPLEQIIPLGLIVNELVINAAKHGAGSITVSFKREPSGGYALSVSDKGKGLPAGFDPVESRGLGMKVIAALVQQLGARLLFGANRGGRGAKFTLLIAGRDQAERPT